MKISKYILISLFLLVLPAVGYNLSLPQEKLVTSLERAIIRLEQIKAKVANETIKQEIAEEIEWTKAKKEQAEQIDNQQELRVLFQEIRSHVRQKMAERRERLKERPAIRAAMPFDRLAGIIPRLEKAMTTLKEKGKETTKLESLLTEFKNLSRETKEKFTLAKEKRDPEALKDSREDLLRLRELIKQIIEEFKLIIK